MPDDSIILTSVLSEPGRIDRNGDMIGYDATMKVDGREYKIDSWQLDEVECPFSIIDDFDRWFEWWRRVEFDGQSKLGATVEMLGLAMRYQRRIAREMERRCFYGHAVGYLNAAESLFMSGAAPEIFLQGANSNSTQAEANELSLKAMIEGRRGPAIHVRDRLGVDSLLNSEPGRPNDGRDQRDERRECP